MKSAVFKSGMASEIQSYLEMKEAAGYKSKSLFIYLKKFDIFCRQRKITTVSFTADDALGWYRRLPDEATTTHYHRVNFIKNFLIYLNRKGYDVYQISDVKNIPTDFKPHIYTDDEIRRYFKAVDTYSPRNTNRFNLIQLPVLFRILYCCGTRINETLGIRKKDIDLTSGIIALNETKNNNVRYIILSEELLNLMRQYANKSFYLLSDDDYIFLSSNKKRIWYDVIFDLHLKFLLEAGIPYLGGGQGPRIHDWRHTFAVKAFKQLIDKGYDMYVALPILSTYLGHKTIYATEKYLRLTTQIYPYIEQKYGEKINEILGKVANDYEKN